MLECEQNAARLSMLAALLNNFNGVYVMCRAQVGCRYRKRGSSGTKACPMFM
jgi:hypothetical protein